jgi:hypothetical protein
MPRLVVQPGTPGSWDIPLRPGSNRFGRGEANDFQLDDPSVSTSHCEILVANGTATVKDLGSTNGTFVNRARIEEAPLQSGQTLHLGSVEMRYQADAPPLVRAVAAPPTAPPIVVSPAAAAAATEPAMRMCKHHPKAIARFFCGKCQIAFCELCVATRNIGGVSRKSCRRCGAEVTPLQVRIERPVEIGFYARLPGAFAYPFRGTGVLLLIVGMLIFAGMRFGIGAMRVGFRGLALGLVMQVFLGGYLFSYLQGILHSTIVGDQEMPDLPPMSNVLDDIIMPFFRLLGVSLICLLPMVILAIWYISQHETPSGAVLVSAGLFGCIYYPMAFLAVATLDSVAAANPLVVVPSICKVPREYLVTVVLLAVVFTLRVVGDVMINYYFGPLGLFSRSMARLLEMFGAKVFWSFVSLYLLTVTMRILGLLYLTKKDLLGWHSR